MSLQPIPGRCHYSHFILKQRLSYYNRTRPSPRSHANLNAFVPVLKSPLSAACPSLRL
jgi:hypothetical protein